MHNIIATIITLYLLVALISWIYNYFNMYIFLIIILLIFGIYFIVYSASDKFYIKKYSTKASSKFADKYNKNNSKYQPSQELSKAQDKVDRMRALLGEIKQRNGFQYSQDSQETQNKLDKLKNLKKAEDSLDKLIATHISTLSIKKDQLCFKDEYGLIDSSRWDAEVLKFIDKVCNKFLPNPTAYNHQKISSRIESAINTHKKNSKKKAYSEAISPIEYEHYCARILTSCGWKTRVTSASGDQGADVIAEISGIVVVIQCKKYTGSVGNTAVQEVHAAKDFYNAHKAVVVTNSQFTKSARQVASKLGVLLLHHDDLLKLIEKLDIKKPRQI